MRRSIPRSGETRIRAYFALRPVVAERQDTRRCELRWLERVVVFQKFTGDTWVTLRFIDPAQPLITYEQVAAAIDAIETMKKERDEAD